MSCCDDEITVYDLIRDLFVAGSITCFLLAAHRIAKGLVLTGQVAAYDTLADAYTPEEREALVHKIKVNSERYW